MSIVRIIIDTDLSAIGFNSVCNMSPGELEGANALSSYFASLAGGNQIGLVDVVTGAVQARATITSTGTATNNETMLLCNVTLTAKTSGAVSANGEFNISAVVATQATNMALAINSVAGLSGIVTATSALGVVTITSIVPGKLSNGLQLSEALGNVTATAFSGGVNGTAFRLDLR